MIKKRFSDLRLVLSFLLIIDVFLNPNILWGQSVVLNSPLKPTVHSIPPTAFLKGLILDVNNPLEMQFIVEPVSPGTSQGSSEIEEQGERMIRYFLAALATPAKDLWVNLSPFEENRIVPDILGQTDLGRDMLEQDRVLKKIVASFLHPDHPAGHDFWEVVYRKAFEEYGVTDIPIDTFHKVWIMPDIAEVHESGQAVYVTKARLKVMLEQDYIALQQNKEADSVAQSHLAPQPSKNWSTDIIREVILPVIEEEVNHSDHFIPLRQIYHALILAQWYKETITHSILKQTFLEQNKIKGVDLSDKNIVQKIYHHYIKDYQTGVFNFIREEYDFLTKQAVPRKYVSGGLAEMGFIPLSEAPFWSGRLPEGTLLMNVVSEPQFTDQDLDTAMLSTQKVHVLAIDDDHIQRGLYQRHLLGNGDITNLHMAEGQDDALEMFRQHPEINFLVVDFQLASFETDQMDNGVELIRRLVEAGFEGRIVILSANDTQIIRALSHHPSLNDLYLREGQISISLKGDPEFMVEVERSIYNYARPDLEAEEKALRSREPVSAESILAIPLQPIGVEEFGAEVGFWAGVQRDYHFVLADDDPMILATHERILRAAGVEHIEQASTVQDALGRVEALRSRGISDEQIVVLSDYEFGESTPGQWRENGYDLLHRLRQKVEGDYEGERMNFEGPIIFISGSVISRDQMEGYNRLTGDVDREIRERYGFDYFQKNGEEEFGLGLLRLINERLQEPYEMGEAPKEPLKRRVLSVPRDISYLNGKVNDFVERLGTVLRDLSAELLEDEYRDVCSGGGCTESVALMRQLMSFKEVSPDLSFNVRVHQYKGLLGSMVALGVRPLRERLQGGGLSDRVANRLLDQLTQAAQQAIHFMDQLYELSGIVGNLSLEVRVNELLERTVGEFASVYGDQIAFEVVNEDEYKSTELPYAMIHVLSVVIQNAIDQYQITKSEQRQWRIVLGMDKRGLFFHIEIVDEAGGVEDGLGEKIYGRKFSGEDKEGGHGYGLWWARELLKMLGGSINNETVGEEGGRGERFDIKVPLRWKELLLEEQRDLEPLIGLIREALSGKGMAYEEDELPVLALEVRKFAETVAEVTEKIEYFTGAQFWLRSLKNYWNYVPFKKQDLDVLFQMGSEFEDVEQFMVALLGMESREELLTSSFSTMRNRQVIPLGENVKNRGAGEKRVIDIIVRSSRNVAQNTKVTEKMRRDYQRVLRMIDKVIHSMANPPRHVWGGSSELRDIIPEKVDRIKATAFKDAYQDALPSELYLGWFQTIAHNVHFGGKVNPEFLTGQEDEVAIVERFEAFRSTFEILAQETGQFIANMESLVVADEGRDKFDQFMTKPRIYARRARLLAEVMYERSLSPDQIALTDVRADGWHFQSDQLNWQWGRGVVLPMSRLAFEEIIYKTSGFQIFKIFKEGENVVLAAQLEEPFDDDPDSLMQWDNPYSRNLYLRDIVEAAGGTFQITNIDGKGTLQMTFPDAAMMGTASAPMPFSPDYGGIDTTTINLRRSGESIDFNIDPALIDQLSRKDFSGLRPIFQSTLPIKSLPKVFHLSKDSATFLN